LDYYIMSSLFDTPMKCCHVLALMRQPPIDS
jgi:hypothetical protein